MNWNIRIIGSVAAVAAAIAASPKDKNVPQGIADAITAALGDPSTAAPGSLVLVESHGHLGSVATPGNDGGGEMKIQFFIAAAAPDTTGTTPAPAV